MDQRLYDAARMGDVDALDGLRNADPLILNKVCQAHFAETPLHVAALAGQTEFAKEIVRLMPSFARELNRDGFAPMHIASARGDEDLLLELLKLDEDRSLCLQRDNINGQIPLHYAVVRGRIPVIEKLISHCSESLQEVTALGETVLHLAAKNSQSEALRIVLERLKGLECFEKLLSTKDYQGRGKTIVELAQARRQVQVLKVLKEYQDGHSVNDASAKSPGNDYEIMEVPIDTSSGSETHYDKQESNKEGKKEKKPENVDLANLVLTAAVLIATETYQAGLAPPETLLKEYNLNPRCIFTARDYFIASEQEVMRRHCPAFYFYTFMIFNTAGFLCSVILILIVTLRYAYAYRPSRLLSLSILSLLVNYLRCLQGLLKSQREFVSTIYSVSGASVILFSVFVTLMFWLSKPAINQYPTIRKKCKPWLKMLDRMRDQAFEDQAKLLRKIWKKCTE